MSGAIPISTGPSLNQAQHASKTQQGSQPGHMAQGSATAQAGASASTLANAQTTQQTNAGDTKRNTKDAQTKDFPEVFNNLLQSNIAGSEKPAVVMAVPAAAGTNHNDKTTPGDGEHHTADTAAIAGALPVFAADTGKALPQVSWSGYAAVADNKGASALAMKGDREKVVATPAVTGKDIPNAVLKAQQALAHAHLQQGVGAGSDAGNFSAVMNKENAHGLQLTHQYLADNASLPQAHANNSAATTNPHNAVVADIGALTASSGTRSGDNSVQQISVPVQNQQWPQQVGDRVHWMIGQNLQQAEIHLHPPELGSLQVHIQVHGDQANVNFSSPHAVVRHALDDAIPRLREMLHETGLTLGDVNVSGQALAHQQSQDSHAQQGHPGHPSGTAHVEEPQAIVATSPVYQLHANRMLDVFA